MNTVRPPAAPVLLAGVFVMGACGRQTAVELVATLEAGRLEHLEVVAWPYDPVRLLDSLAALAPRPRPDLSALEAELAAFRRPEYDEDDEQTREWAAVRDSVRRLSDSLSAADRSSPGYREAYGRFRALYERMLQRTAARDAGARELTAEVRDLALRAGEAADSLRAWEAEAYAGLDAAAARAAHAAGRSPVVAVLDAEGRSRLELAPGAWWLTLDAPHPDNPFLEYRWVLPVTVSGFPVRVPLLERTATLEWRH